MFKIRLPNLVSTVNKTISLCRTNIHTTAVKKSDVRLEKTINQVCLLGRAGNDAQKRGTEDHPVVVFSLATHNNYKYDSGDMIQRTDWHRVSIFRPGLRDTVLQYLKKGQRIYVTGRLTYGEFKTDDGELRSTASIIADDVIFLQQNKNNDVPSS